MKENKDKDCITPEEFVQKYKGNPKCDTDLGETDTTLSYELRTRQIIALSERMLSKIDLAIDQIDLSKIKVKEKIKEVEYDEESKKPISEKLTEKEKTETEKSVIDTSSLKQLVSTLKDIKDIHTALADNKSSDNDNESGVIVISDLSGGEADK